MAQPPNVFSLTDAPSPKHPSGEKHHEDRYEYQHCTTKTLTEVRLVTVINIRQCFVFEDT